jgi:hypothetical protein
VELWRKDVLIVGSDTRGAVVATFSQGEPPDGTLRWWPVDAVEKLLKYIFTDNILSRHVLHSLPVIIGDIVAGSYRVNSLELGEDILVDQLKNWAKTETITQIIKDRKWEECAKLSGQQNISARTAILCLLSQLSPKHLLRDFEKYMSELDLVNAEKIIERMLDTLQVVSADRLQIEGVDYASNPYMSTFKEGDEIRLPLLFSVFGLAYIYASALGDLGSLKSQGGGGK